MREASPPSPSQQAWPSFDLAQGRAYYGHPRLIRKQAEWQPFREAYRHWHQQFPTKATPQVPRIFHHIWLGGEPPEWLQALHVACRQLHPGWRFWLWRDSDWGDVLGADAPPLESLNPGAASDLMRYALLYRYGGLYADWDFLWLRPIPEELLHCEAFAGLGHDNHPTLLNGLIGASAEHPLIGACWGYLRGQPGALRRQGNAIPSGPRLLTEQFVRRAAQEGPPRAGLCPLPHSFVYPLPEARSHIAMPRALGYVQAETLAVHLWEASWQASLHRSSLLELSFRRLRRLRYHVWGGRI